MLNDARLKKLFFLIIAVLLLSFFQISRTLVWGWILFLIDVLPRIRPDWASVLLAIVATVLFAAGIHWWGRSAGRAQVSQSRWSFRSTICLVSVLFLLFIAGISMVGVTHQAIWLSTSKEPRFQETLGNYRGSTRYAFREIGMALHNYHDIHRSFPIGGTYNETGIGIKSWTASIQPDMWHRFSDGYDDNTPWDQPPNQKYFLSVHPGFINSELQDSPIYDSKGYGLSHYAANSHVMGGNKSLKIRDITDGTSNTLFIGEVNANFLPWGHPFNYRDPALARIMHECW